MISSQILQNTIDGLKNISHLEMCVLDVEGKEVAGTTAGLSVDAVTVRNFVQSPAETQEIGERQFFKIYDEMQLEYILIVAGGDEATYTMGKVFAYQIQGLLTAYKERFDKDNFIKNLLLDNMLLVDVYARAKKLHIENQSRRIAMIVANGTGHDGNLLEAVRSALSSATDFVTEVDEGSVVVVRDIGEQGYDELMASAGILQKTLTQGGAQNIRISYGTIVAEIKDVSRSYKEAKMAMDVGRIFFEQKNIICYSELGIGRLIYQLPVSLCKMFIEEVFGGRKLEEFDEETMTTIDKFFENNLNVSETSRQLFIHRNTLVYRLDKLQKSTGLDLRVFDHAITFKIAMMVMKYMKYMDY